MSRRYHICKRVLKICKKASKGTLLTPEQTYDQIIAGTFIVIMHQHIAVEILQYYHQGMIATLREHDQLQAWREDIKDLRGVIPLETYKEISRALDCKPTFRGVIRALRDCLNAIEETPYTHPTCDRLAEACYDALCTVEFHYDMYKIGVDGLKYPKAKREKIIRKHTRMRLDARVNMLRACNMSADLKARDAKIAELESRIVELHSYRSNIWKKGWIDMPDFA